MTMSKFPLRLVFWEITARCNLHCQHCRAEASAEPEPGELNTDELVQTARQVRSVDDPIVILTGGEPLVRPDFFDVAKGCTRLFSRVALATNGTLIDGAQARRIVSLGIRRASISLDGAEARSHDAFRGVPGAFDAALRGFDALRAAGADVQVNVTLTQRNEPEIDALLALALERGACAFHVFVLVPVGCGTQIDAEERLSAERTERVLERLFEHSVRLRERLSIKATCAPQYARIMRQMARRKGIALPTGPHAMNTATGGCLAGISVCFISRKGDVRPCGYMPMTAGNVRETPFPILWDDAELFSSLRDVSRLSGKCGVCTYRKVCRGCRARSLALTGNLFAEDQSCAYQPPRGATRASRASSVEPGD